MANMLLGNLPKKVTREARVWKKQRKIEPLSSITYIQLIQKRLSFGNLKFKLQNTKYKKKYVTSHT